MAISISQYDEGYGTYIRMGDSPKQTLLTPGLIGGGQVVSKFWKHSASHEKCSKSTGSLCKGTGPKKFMSPTWSIMDDLGRYVLDYTGKWRC